MKKFSVIFISILLGVVAMFGIAGCGSDTQSELQGKETFGTFYSLQEAYDYGWLTQDDLMSIACCYYDSYKYDENPYAGKYALTEEINENIATEIKQVYLEQKAKFPEGDRDLVYIKRYYGNYNGNIVVSIQSDYFFCDIIVEEEFYIGGVVFKNFWQGDILVYHMD